MKPKQIYIVAAAMFCDLQQIIHAVEPRFLGQIVCDVGKGNLRDRIDNDVPFVHRVTTAYLYTGAFPDTDAAFDSAEPDAHAKSFCEHHMQPHPMATGRY